MPLDDAWDWPYLLYTGTIILKMSEQYFWRLTPRKLNALVKVHMEVNNGKETEQKPKFIDQIL